MSQFRPLPSFQVPVDLAQAQDRVEERPITTSPLLFPLPQTPSTPTTEALPGLRPVITTEQLTAIVGTGSLSLAEKRIVRIPAERKATTTEPLAHSRRRMSPRLRHGIILFAAFFVGVFTLLSLAPLASGDTGIPFFRAISNWERSQSALWQIESQIVQVGQPHKTVQQPVSLPPVVLPQSAYIAIAEQDASAAGISPQYFVRQINLESGFNPNAVSPSGAEGIAQFLPSTAASLGINPFNPIQALKAAANVMAGYNATYHGNYAMALAAYNAGSGTVQYAVNACGSNWMNCLPAETQNYIRVIMGI